MLVDACDASVAVPYLPSLFLRFVKNLSFFFLTNCFIFKINFNVIYVIFLSVFFLHVHIALIVQSSLLKNK